MTTIKRSPFFLIALASGFLLLTWVMPFSLLYLSFAVVAGIVDYGLTLVGWKKDDVVIWNGLSVGCLIGEEQIAHQLSFKNLSDSMMGSLGLFFQFFCLAQMISIISLLIFRKKAETYIGSEPMESHKP